MADLWGIDWQESIGMIMSYNGRTRFRVKTRICYQLLLVRFVITVLGNLIYKDVDKLQPAEEFDVEVKLTRS